MVLVLQCKHVLQVWGWSSVPPSMSWWAQALGWCVKQASRV